MQSVRLTFLQKIRWKNPRDRVGGGFRSLLLDHMGFSINMYNCNISIHVSLRRRRTPGRDLIKARYTISTHISARERTPSFKCSLNALSVLQLTSPQRDEHFSSFNSLRIVYFNSRLCKETNAAFALLSPSATISIHVSAMRRTKIITQIKQIYLISTHVSARRRT